MRFKKNISYAVLVKFVQAFLLLLCCCSVVPALYGSGGGNECRIGEILQTQEKMTLACTVKTIDKEFRVANLTSVPAGSFRGLRVTCSELYYFQSVITPETLVGFSHISRLEVINCKISELSDRAFTHVKSLKQLRMRTRNSDWSATSMILTIAPDVFRPLTQLERLDLSNNNIWELPKGLFCPLPNLKSLNISRNHLQDLTQLGFAWDGQKTRSNRSLGCRSDLTSMDLSYNDADVLVAAAFKGLTNLNELYLQSNNIGKIDDDAFRGLQSLTKLDLSNNRLVVLPESAFIYTPQLLYLYVRNNTLTRLSPGLFGGLKHLLELDLSHNELKSEWLTVSSFQELIRLVVLDLSHNKISQLDPQLFRGVNHVQKLRLSHNLLLTLPPSSFKPCLNLHTLDISNNEIHSLPQKAFEGVDVLSFLALDNNKISDIHVQAFANLKSLEDLNINGNHLKFVPRAISHLHQIKTLDLGDNQIRSLKDLPVQGLDLLYGLRLVNNRISGNISKDTFVNIPSLKILNLAKNSIAHIENDAFMKNKNLQAIRLDANLLSSMNDLFESLPNLEWLNVSDNNIELFDYHFIPPSLLWLDLHKNKIEELSNALGRHDLALQTLDASFNKLKRISSSQIPNSVRLVFLNDNKINTVEQFTFLNKENLTRVDLFANKLNKMEKQALRLIPVSADKPLPQFYLGGNSFMCDCNMEWLQTINNVEQDHRVYPTIMDMESIYCQMPFTKGGIFKPLVDVESSQFLCQYESHCFSLCHCCEFDACDCEMTCPDGCGCYHDHSWSSNIVNCSNNDLTAVPDRIPMDATEVYLDGNSLRDLSSHSFIGRKHLKVLFVNGSGVSSLDNETFSGLSRLMILHLENNLLSVLRGHELKYLTMLRELYLHNNQLHYIHQNTFVDMIHLEILTLNSNRLINFPVWRMVDNPYLSRIALGDNRWTCECQFVESFEIWLSSNSRKVVDNDDIKCISSSGKNPDAFIIDFNATKCLNSSSTSTVIQPMILTSLLHPVIAISVAFVVIILLLVCFFYRNSLRVFLFSRCGLRPCQKDPALDDRDKLWDAFVSYSSKDEVWVNQILANELERGEKPYRLCLHYRDYPVTHYITDTIVEAVESSKRTIVVLSKNFIENEWCRFQFKSAHHEMLKKKQRERLIVILLGDIPSRDLDPDLRLYLKTNPCIRSNDKLFWEKLRFAMPDKPHCQRAVHTYSTIPERTGINKYSVNSPPPPPAAAPALHHHHRHPNDRQITEAYWA